MRIELTCPGEKVVPNLHDHLGKCKMQRRYFLRLSLENGMLFSV